MKSRTYFLVLVNDIMKDYSLMYDVALSIAQGYRKALSSTSTVQVLEVRSVTIFDVV